MPLFCWALSNAESVVEPVVDAPEGHALGSGLAVGSAGDRGEPALRYIDVLDCILAPIYLRTLFGVGPDAADLATFVERALTQRT